MKTILAAESTDGFVIEPQYVWLPMVAAIAYLAFVAYRGLVLGETPYTFYGWIAPLVCIGIIITSIGAMVSGNGLVIN